MSHQGVLSTKQQEAAFLKILKKQCNLICADCSSKSPTWASLDFGVFVCYNCSGQHRALGQNITRVRSTKLDYWTQENVDLMDTLGNDQNEYWESRLQKTNKIQPSANPEEIKLFVQEKYIKRTWVKQGQADPKTRYTQCLMSGVPFRVAKTNTFFSENGTQGIQIKDDMKQFHSTQQQGIQRNTRQFSIDSKQTQKEANLISPDRGKEFDWNSFNHFSTFSGVANNHFSQSNQVEIPVKKQQLNESQSPTFKAKHNNLNEFDLLTFPIQADSQQFMSYNPSHQTTQQQQIHQFNSHNPSGSITSQQSWSQAQKQAQVQSQQQQINQCQQNNQLQNQGNNSFGINNQQQGWGSQSYQQAQQSLIYQPQQQQQNNQVSSKPPLPAKPNPQQGLYQNTNIQQQQPQIQKQQANYQTANYSLQQNQVQPSQPYQQQQTKDQLQYQIQNQNQQSNPQNFGFNNQINNTNNNQQIYQGFDNISFPFDQGNHNNKNNNNNNNTNNNNNNNNQYHNQFHTTNQFSTQKYLNNPFVKDAQDIRNLYNTQQPNKYDQLRNNPFV